MITLSGRAKLSNAEVRVARLGTIARSLVAATTSEATSMRVTVIDLGLSQSINLLKAWNRCLRYGPSCHSYNEYDSSS